MRVPGVRIACIAAALAAALFSLTAGTTPYPGFIAAVLFVMAAVVTTDREQSRILLLATGELLVIASAAASFPAGFVVQGAVIGAVFLDGTVLPEKRDALLYGLWVIAALAGAAVLYFSNQVLLPFLAITALVAVTTAVLIGIQELRERRLFRGGTG